MKKAIEIYVDLINKFVDIICKLFKKQEGFCNFLNNKIVRKILPWFFLLTMSGFVVLVVCLVYKSKKK